MGYEINFSPFKGNGSLTTHEYYQKYSNSTIGELGAILPLIKTDLNACLPSDENTEIIAYLSWIVRIVTLGS